MINGISLSTIAHATEDSAKVKDAILNLVPEPLRGICQVNSVSAKGHYGNPITVLTLEIRDKQRAKEIVDYTIRLLPIGDRIRIKDQINIYYDGRSTLFLRVDKQTAFLGTPRLSLSDDVIHIKISVIERKGDLTSILKIFDLT
jgi:RNA binding exosome subunit